jgi:hypothetical protein
MKETIKKKKKKKKKNICWTYGQDTEEQRVGSGFLITFIGPFE